ncbi:hypothetical protein [Clostridium sp.]
MNKISIRFDKFNFKVFVDDMVTFAAKIMDYDYLVAWVDREGGYPQYNDENQERDYLTELKKEGKMLYFYFSDVNTEDPIKCADGCEYEIDRHSRFGLGHSDTVGYLLNYKEGELSINSAINFGESGPGPFPSINIREDCDVFDEPMERFILKFI